MNAHVYRIAVLMVLLLSACSQTAPATPTVTQRPEPTLASLPDGNLVYGDPAGRFTFPLPMAGEWTAVESDGSYAGFTLADPSIELYVVTAVGDGVLKAVAEAALMEIGVDSSALSLLDIETIPPWSLYVYSFEDGQGVGVAVRVLDDVSVAIIPTAEMSVLSSLRLPFLAAIDGFATMPLAEYLEFRLPPAPSAVKDIADLDAIEFYSGRTKLVGRLDLPKGEGPFPAIVYAGHGSGMTTRSSHLFLRNAGFAVFSYDKRGAGDSEGVFVEVGLETGDWRLPQLAGDALAAVAFLQGLEEINPNQIGLMGVSQNGWTIPVAASQSDAVAFTVIVAGPTVSLGEELYWSDITGGAEGISAGMRDEFSEQMAAYDGPRGFDPRPSLEAMSIPGLWIWGDKDGSVPARESKAILESIVEEYDKDFSILYFPDAGHSLGTASPEVVDWILAHLEK